MAVPLPAGQWESNYMGKMEEEGSELDKSEWTIWTMNNTLGNIGDKNKCIVRF